MKFFFTFTLALLIVSCVSKYEDSKRNPFYYLEFRHFLIQKLNPSDRFFHGMESDVPEESIGFGSIEQDDFNRLRVGDILKKSSESYVIEVYRNEKYLFQIQLPEPD